MAEEKVEEAPAAEPQSQFVGGEVVIKADAQTGSISITGPKNILTTLGIIEGAKVILAMQMQDAMRMNMMKRQPDILKAGPDALKNLSKIVRPS